MIKIFDCSNSIERPPHRNGGGPIVNDVMRYLQENCKHYGFEFVATAQLADVIITNDVFPREVLELKKPLVKRMDGVFWHKHFVERNHPLNMAAQQADTVIFITNYSRDSFFKCYNYPLKNYNVVRHWVDPKVFYRVGTSLNKKFTFCASATDWNREEKRYLSIIKFADMFKNDIHLNLIGKTHPIYLTPSNVTKYGYTSDPKEMAKIFNRSDGFINLSYRDAATKTAPQAISCGLPVLYAQSGGVSEMVGEYGIPINEIENFDFIDYIPKLTEYQLEKGFKDYMCKFNAIRESLKSFNPNDKFEDMLKGYFDEIKKVI
jgi:glycosyltransferase involved in cell wall biosynthesis